MVLRRFISRLDGILKEWYIGLGEYRQRQFQQMTTIDAAIQVLYAEFLSRPDHYYQISHEEYLQMKCRQMKPKAPSDSLCKVMLCNNESDIALAKVAFMFCFLMYY